MLHTHSQVPMFAARNRIDDRVVDYRELWQRKQLVLVSLAANDDTRTAYTKSLLAKMPALTLADTVLVVTSDAVPGVPQPGVVVADRWGEVRFVADGSRATDLPESNVLADWVASIGMECPECEGETR